MKLLADIILMQIEITEIKIKEAKIFLINFIITGKIIDLMDKVK